MARLLVVATGPLLDAPDTRLVSGQCLRTMHFVRPLRAAGHDVHLLTVPIPGTESGEDKAPRQEHTPDGIAYTAFATHDEAHIVPHLRRLLASERFDACVGVNAWPAYLLARAEPAPPFWADLNGWTMAEGQTRATLVGHDRDLDHFWRLEVGVLLAADRFSTVSARQADALHGELALVGRLNSLTFDWPFAEAVPNAVHALYAGLQRGTIKPNDWPTEVPRDRPVVLWSGGFNTWTDIGMLADALERALASEPTLHFAATGGAVQGHDDSTFERFKALARERLPADRCALLGWVPTGQVLALHAGAAVGINIDSRNTETRFGARNRLTNMLGAGLPVATTRGTEIAEWIERHGAGAVVEPGDAGALAAALVEAARSREAWATRAAEARRRALHDFAPEETLKRFLDWCEAPSRAPDREAAGSARGTEVRELEARRWAALKAAGEVDRILGDVVALARLRRKWPLRWWYAARRIWKGR
ncbi:MAG: glycosyltransferase [Candidatus Sumerlaeia bacterium]|nr:glycosyltransferase [Candidatus Sumerlaeia bacterium]